MIVVILILSFLMLNVSSLKHHHHHHHRQQQQHRHHHHSHLPQARSMHLKLFNSDSKSGGNVSALVSRKPNANKKNSLQPLSSSPQPPSSSPQPASLSSSVKNIFSNFFSNDIRFTRIENDIVDIKNDFKIGLGILLVSGGI